MSPSDPQAAGPVPTSISSQIYSAGEALQKGFGSPAMSSPPVNANKQLDFDLGMSKLMEPVTPSTPAVTPAPAAASSATSDDDIDYNQFMLDVLLWTNVVRSAFYLVAGTTLILLIDYLVDHHVPLITVVCRLTLAQMALNFARHVISPNLQQKATWLDSAWTQAAISSVGSSVKTLAAVHDKHLSGSSPHKHLVIAIALWVLALTCCWITPTHLALVLYIGAFLVPKVYTLNRAAIDPKLKDAVGVAKAKFEAADRRVKAAIIMVTVFAVGCISYVNLVIAVFILCLFANSQLPGEVAQLGKKAAPVLTPLGKTAANVGGQIGKLVGGAVQKYELTPTPLKKKKL